MFRERVRGRACRALRSGDGAAGPGGGPRLVRTSTSSIDGRHCFPASSALLRGRRFEAMHQLKTRPRRESSPMKDVAAVPPATYGGPRSSCGRIWAGWRFPSSPPSSFAPNFAGRGRKRGRRSRGLCASFRPLASSAENASAAAWSRIGLPAPPHLVFRSAPGVVVVASVGDGRHGRQGVSGKAFPAPHYSRHELRFVRRSSGLGYGRSRWDGGAGPCAGCLLLSDPVDPFEAETR